MTLVGDGMARPGGGEGPNHLWNHLNSQSPPTHRCHILEATLCPTKLVKQPQYIFHKRIQQQINNYKSPLKLEYSFTIFLSNLDDTKGSCQKRFSGFCPLRGHSGQKRGGRRSYLVTLMFKVLLTLICPQNWAFF